MDERIRTIFNRGMRKITTNPIYMSLLASYILLGGIEKNIGISFFLDKFLIIANDAKQVVAFSGIF
jgi:hypothetical protein